MSQLTLRNFQSHGLNPINLELSPNSCTTLAGPSGCGKTLLLRAMADLDEHQGEILLDNTPLTSFPPPQWRRQVGLLPAESHWWNLHVADHFSETPEQLLKALGLPSECMAWETQRISSGERQRLALARLLSGAPGVLLLDEPTANLDQKNIERVEALIKAYRSEWNAAVLWVSHDPQQRRRVGERQLIFNNGNLENEQWS